MALRAALVGVLLVGALTGGGQSDPNGCGERGTQTDVAHEPPYARSAFPAAWRWRDGAGCRVRLDVLATEDIRHCGWIVLVFAHHGYMASRHHAAVPANARLTEYNRGPVRLWIAADGRTVYVGERNDATRWVRSRGRGGCA